MLQRDGLVTHPNSLQSHSCCKVTAYRVWRITLNLKNGCNNSRFNSIFHCQGIRNCMNREIVIHFFTHSWCRSCSCVIKYKHIMIISVLLATMIIKAYCNDVLWSKPCEQKMWCLPLRAFRRTAHVARMHDLQTAALCDLDRGKLLRESAWILQGARYVLMSNFLPCCWKYMTYSRDCEQRFFSLKWQACRVVCILLLQLILLFLSRSSTWIFHSEETTYRSPT